MGKAKKDLLSKAPWRGEEDDESQKFKDAKLKVTSEAGSTSTMHVPRKNKSSKYDSLDEDDDSLQIDPQLRYSFQRNFQSIVFHDGKPFVPTKRPCSSDSLEFLQRVFSIDTVVKPLPPTMAYNVSRNLSFFTRIFTQFFDPEGIANAQKSLGLGQEEKTRRVR